VHWIGFGRKWSWANGVATWALAWTHCDKVRKNRRSRSPPLRPRFEPSTSRM
jgi:hypothetical protein